MKDTIIVYHGNCPDGFGGAYSAWKKLGDSASYIPAFHGEPAPQGLEGKEVFFIDFSYPKEKLLEIEKKAKRFVVLDHHIGAKEAVETIKEHVFDNDRSGSGIAWEYFHSELPLPRLLAYIQDADLWKNSLPNIKEFSTYLSKYPFEFEAFDALAKKVEGDEGFKEVIEKGRAYWEYFDYLCEKILQTAEEVEFSGYKVLAVTAPRVFRSEVGNRLAKTRGPFGIVWYPEGDKWHFSLRGDGSIDLSEFCKKYVGGGHHNAAGFTLPRTAPFPFTSLK